MTHTKPKAAVFNWSEGKLVPLKATLPMTESGWEKAGIESRNRMKEHRHIKEQWEKGEFLKEAHELKR